MVLSISSTPNQNNEKIRLTDSKEFIVTKKIVANPNDIELSNQFAIPGPNQGDQTRTKRARSKKTEKKILSGRNMHSSLVIQKRLQKDSSLSIT